jgi:hypothetical protein
MKKPVTISVQVSRDDFIRHYLVLWNGMLNLTEKELDLLEALIEKYLELVEVIKDRKYLYDFLFSPSVQKEIRDRAKMKEQTFHNYKASLKAKGIIVIDNDGNLSLDPKVIPMEEITFKFKINEQ